MHKKNQVIKTKHGYFKCICVDADTAVYAPSNKSGTKTRYRNLFAVSNNPKDDSFEFEVVK